MRNQAANSFAAWYAKRMLASSDDRPICKGPTFAGEVLAGARAAYERALRILEKALPPDRPYIQIVPNHGVL